MKIGLDDLGECIAQLIRRGASDVAVEFLGGLAILGWRFPGQPGDCLPLELEELCRLSGSCC